ncbi:MAG: replication-relaxation family protein [Candidatus Hydrogenedentes bacterium]|nr:replication-relaxation family protein [Candidatus Hydrogenedentota bacterium]
MRIDSRLLDLLMDMAEYRVLSASQVTHLRFSRLRSARRRMQQLCGRRFVKLLPGQSGGGRPENVYGLAKGGYELLVSQGRISGDGSYDKFGGESLLNQLSHHLLLNWTRVHLVEACRQNSRLESFLLASKSPLVGRSADGSSLVADKVTLVTGEEPVGLAPDAVFIMKHKRSTEATLFFLEIDMGTEPGRRTDRGVSSIEDKVKRYKAYFRSGQYKTKYEAQWHVPLRGFRTLFMTSTPQGARSISDLLRQMKPSGFCWVTSREQMVAQGISGNIWQVGGQPDSSADSIFDAYAFSCPLPSIPE